MSGWTTTVHTDLLCNESNQTKNFVVWDFDLHESNQESFSFCLNCIGFSRLSVSMIP
jgi:hypothetical protein